MLGRAVISPDLGQHMQWLPAAQSLVTEAMNVVGGVAVGTWLWTHIWDQPGEWRMILLISIPVTHCRKVAAHPHPSVVERPSSYHCLTKQVQMQ